MLLTENNMNKGMTMKIYLTKIENAEVEELQKYVSLCDEKRQQAVAKYRFDADKIRGIIAGLLLRYAYRIYQLEHNEIPANRVILDYHENGKPYMKDNESFRFSLSHAGDYVLLACGSCEVGADIEQVKEKSNVLAMSKRFFRENEYQVLCEMKDDEQRNREFIRIWTQKESYIKYLGQGLKYGMNSFYRNYDGMVIDEKMPDVTDVKIQEITDIPGYCASVCYTEDEDVHSESTFTIEEIPIDLLIKK